MIWPFKDLAPPLVDTTEKLQPLGARNRSSLSIASAFASSKNPSSNVHKPIPTKLLDSISLKIWKCRSYTTLPLLTQPKKGYYSPNYD